MQTCPLCAAAEGFKLKLRDGQAMFHCRACHGVIPQLAEAVTAAAEGEDAEDPRAAAPAPATPHRPPPFPATQAVAPARQKATQAAEQPVDIVKLARRRLRDVNREIARLKKLETERDQLERLLAAAEGAPAPVVEGVGHVVAGLAPRARRLGN